MADCSRPEVDSDIISGRIENGVEANLCANFGDPASSDTFLFAPTRPPAHPVRYDNTRSLEATLRRAVKISLSHYMIFICGSYNLSTRTYNQYVHFVASTDS